MKGSHELFSWKKPNAFLHGLRYNALPTRMKIRARRFHIIEMKRQNSRDRKSWPRRWRQLRRALSWWTAERKNQTWGWDSNPSGATVGKRSKQTNKQTDLWNARLSPGASEHVAAFLARQPKQVSKNNKEGDLSRQLCEQSRTSACITLLTSLWWKQREPSHSLLLITLSSQLACSHTALASEEGVAR